MTNTQRLPRPPAWLPEDSRREWRRVMRELPDTNDPATRELAALYVEAGKRARLAALRVQDEGITCVSPRGLSRVSDAVRDQTRATYDLLRFYRLLGLDRRRRKP